MAKKTTITSMYDALPKLLKVLLQLVFGVIIGGIYRIVRFLEKGNVVTLIVGLLVTFTGVGNLIIWIVDLYTQITADKISVFAD